VRPELAAMTRRLAACFQGKILLYDNRNVRS